MRQRVISVNHVRETITIYEGFAMSDEPDLSFDIDALFDHMTNNLDRRGDEELDWVFTLRSSSLGLLESAADMLADEFEIRLQENVDEIDEDGNRIEGDPMLGIVRTAALSANEVKEISQRIATIAKENGLSYEGVDCYDPVDLEELFGWIPPDEAGWRLRHMTDCGMEIDDPLPWAFLLVATGFDVINRLFDDLKAAGFNDGETYDEPDEEGLYGMCLFVEGRNNEPELVAAIEQIDSIASNHGGRIEGVQFYTREDVEDVFGEDEDDEL